MGGSQEHLSAQVARPHLPSSTGDELEALRQVRGQEHAGGFPAGLSPTPTGERKKGHTVPPESRRARSPTYLVRLVPSRVQTRPWELLSEGEMGRVCQRREAEGNPRVPGVGGGRVLRGTLRVCSLRFGFETVIPRSSIHCSASTHSHPPSFLGPAHFPFGISVSF